MSRRRLVESETLASCVLDRNRWPVVLMESIPEERRELFERRKKAVDMYFDGEPLASIRAVTGVSEDEVVRLVKRCVSENEYGQVTGYPALIPYKHVGNYRRARTLQGSEGMAGAFDLLLDTYPTLRDEIHTLYLDRRKRMARDPVMSVSRVHARFLQQCRDLGISQAEYPFTTNDGALRSLTRYCKKLDSLFFAEAAKRHGPHAESTAKLTVRPPNATIVRPFERVQFDGHRIDAVMCIRFRTPEGDFVSRTINRMWLLTVIDVATAAVIGYSLSLNKEYTSSDVLRCIRNAVVPHEKMAFTIPGLGYPSLNLGQAMEGGFPSDFIPETKWAKFDEICLDNGKSNLSEAVLDRLENVLHCAVGPGPVGQPQRRGLIERFHGILEEYGFHRLISTTGSNPLDPRRRDAERAAIEYEITFEHLKELTEALIARYNLSPNRRVNNLTPLEAMRQRIQERGMIPRQMDEQEQSEAIFLQTVAQRKVRGSVKSGRRPHINFMDVTYRSADLDDSAYLIGHTLTLRVNVDDLRFVKAFLPDGSEFGNLVAEGKWGIWPHSMELRRAIMDLRHKGYIHIGRDDDPIEVYHRYLNDPAVGSKNARTQLVQLSELLKGQTEEKNQVVSNTEERKRERQYNLQSPKKMERLFKNTLNS